MDKILVQRPLFETITSSTGVGPYEASVRLSVVTMLVYGEEPVTKSPDSHLLSCPLASSAASLVVVLFIFTEPSSDSCAEPCRMLFVLCPRVTTPGKYRGSLPERWKPPAPSPGHGTSLAVARGEVRTEDGRSCDEPIELGDVYGLLGLTSV